jgi:hypothetical protein
LFSRRTAILAAGILAASPLYFRSVVLGQETGLTALSIAATIYLITSTRSDDAGPGMVLAGLAAALCALSREYGWIAVPVGVVALLWRRHSLKHVFLFIGVALLAGGPWYARTWIATGNPFYPLSFANLAVNPIYNGILQYYKSLLGAEYWSESDWLSAIWLVVASAPIQILAGVGGGILQFRKHGYLLVITLLLAGVWIQSVGYTSGGVLISARVLSPALVVLSVLAAAALDRVSRQWNWQTPVIAAVFLCQLWTAAFGVFYPTDPFAIPVSQWRYRAFQNIPSAIEFQVADQLKSLLPEKTRVLSDNGYLHAALSEKGIDVVPVWSPEVRFLFSESAQESARLLKSSGIGSVGYYRASLNTDYLKSASPFYSTVAQQWRAKAEAETGFVVLVPDQ